MADLRIPSQTPPQSGLTSRTNNRSEAARAAQRAFFDAARTGQPVQQAAQPVAPAPVPKTVATPPVRPASQVQTKAQVQPQPQTQTGDEAPRRLPRPGSLVNIVV